MDAFGVTLPIAMAIALGPIPIVGAVLVVSSRKSSGGGLAFTLGWLAGLFVLSVATALLLNLIGPTSPTGHLILNLLRIALGLLLLWAALRMWRSRPRADDEVPVPKWLAVFDDVTAARAVWLGVTLAVANPKHIGLVLAAVAALLYEPKPTIELVAGVLIFVALSSSTVMLVVLAHAIGGSRATAGLDVVKAFMLRNSTVIVMIVFALLGASVLGSGISGLTE